MHGRTPALSAAGLDGAGWRHGGGHDEDEGCNPKWLVSAERYKVLKTRLTATWHAHSLAVRDHERDVRGHLLDVPHELVPDPAAVAVEVIRELATRRSTVQSKCRR